MYVIVGLGNPGKRYENTRHNMGFITVDRIAEQLGVKVDKIKFKSLVGEAVFSGQKVLLVKPQTYMNLSGQAVREVMNFYKADIENLIVIYDDIDIAAGKIRIRKKGSAGTHNGMRDVVYQIQDDAFPRIRVGIKGDSKMELRDFVTGGFTKEEKKPLEEAVTNAVKAALCIISDGIDKAMNEYNVREKKEKPPKPMEPEKKPEDTGGSQENLKQENLKEEEKNGQAMAEETQCRDIQGQCGQYTVNDE